MDPARQGGSPDPVPAPQPPSVGRIVHYVELSSLEGENAVVCRAAIITALPEPDDGKGAYLAVFGRWGMKHVGRAIEYDAPANRHGTWHWPERV